MDLPKTFDEFVDARKQGFIRAKEFKDNGGKLAGCLCSYTPQELLDAAGVATVGLCGTSSETIPDAEKVLPKNLCPLIKSTSLFSVTFLGVEAVGTAVNVLIPIFRILSSERQPVMVKRRCTSC